MKKTVLLLTLALVLAFAAPVFANPFSDVPADHWSYDAISKLAADGVITGNPDGTFTGSRTLTRYEIAVIVAKAMASAEANADKVTAESQATIDKLAAEFGKELKALGVKVAALEKKVGNVKFTGDSRLRYRFDKRDSNGVKTVTTNRYEGRIRLTATAEVNDKVKVVARLSTDDINFSATGGNQNMIADRANVQYTDKKLAVIAGRQSAYLGKGTIIDDRIDGVSVTAPVGNYKATLLHGRLDATTVGRGTAPGLAGQNIDLTALELNGVKFFDKLTLGMDYVQVKTPNKADGFGTDKNQFKIAAVNFDYPVNNKIGLFGEFIKTDWAPTATVKNKHKEATIVGVNVKNVINKTNLNVTYAKYGKNALLTGVTTLPSIARGVTGDTNQLYKVRLDNALMKSTNLYLEWDNVEAKYDNNNPKVKINRFETGLEFKF